MILNADREFTRVRRVRRLRCVRRRAFDCAVILNEHAVEEHRHRACLLQRAIGVELWRVEDHIVRVPLAIRIARIHEWRVLPVHRAGHAVDIRLVGVRPQDLQLITAHEENAAVAAMLIFAMAGLRHHPFNVELARPEGILRLNVATAWRDAEFAVLHSPLACTIA